MVSRPALEPLVISAPFGNYIRPAGTTPTIGTFTARRRGGRPAAFGRAVLTVRHYRRLGAWVNRIGLRNPGIDSVRPEAARGCILSVHGFTPQEWEVLLDRARHLRPEALELNISCPNVGEVTWPDSLFADAVSTGVPVIVKIPPIRYQPLARAAAEAGITWFHATNTLPVPGGGMSGAPLKPLSLEAVAWLRARLPHAGIIGGGGISNGQDIADYAGAGADAFAVGSYAMRPAALVSDTWISEIRAAALATRDAGGVRVRTSRPSAP